MRPSLERANRLLQAGLLRCASLLVPVRQRQEWGREWRAELWHVRQERVPEGGVSWQGQREVAAFCLGAFQDALCIRRAGRQESRQQRLTVTAMDGTARQCIFAFVALLAASYALSLLLPGVRAERSLWPRKVNPNLVLIQQFDVDGSQATISPEQLRSWEGRRQKYFDGFAFYRVTQQQVDAEPVLHGPHPKARWGVARTSVNLFAILGMSVQLDEAREAPALDLPAVILSERVWKSEFAADPHVAGAVVHLGAQTARIAGVAPDGSLGLPGHADAWLLDPDAESGPGGNGYVIAHLTPAGAAAMWASCVHITARGPDQSEDDLMGVSLEDWKPTPQDLYLFALFLAVLSLPAITAVSLGESSLCLQQTSWPGRLRRWSFLTFKIALLLPIVYFVSLDLAYGCTAIGHEQAGLVQLFSTFSMCLFGMRWVLKDQRQRCPVCLRRVAHPAQVGHSSRTFLEWNGTEMMCLGGHALLHVPSLPTSWFGAQRWLYLDPSWAFLFVGKGAGMENEAITGLL
jgi:hypothetical protein